MQIYRYPNKFDLIVLLKRMYQFRSFWFYLALKWLRIKYDESYLGLLWVIINPLFIAGFYAIIFGWVLGGNNDHYPYFLVVYSGIIIWQFFRDCLLEMGESFLREPSVSKRTSFPKIIIPLSVVSIKFLELIVSLIVLCVIYTAYGSLFSINSLLLLVNLVSLLLFTAGMGMLLAPIFVMYRDIKHIVRFVLPYLLYTFPVLFTQKNIPVELLSYWEYNPVAYQIQFLRYLLFNETIELYSIWLHFLLCFLVFAIGFWFFTKQEKKLIDLI